MESILFSELTLSEQETLQGGGYEVNGESNSSLSSEASASSSASGSQEQFQVQKLPPVICTTPPTH